MVNFLEETIIVLSQHGKTLNDIVWIGSNDGRLTISVNTFRGAANFIYDDGFGGQEIPKDIVVVGTDWWLERGEYDGSEWWEFKQIPVLNEQAKAFTTIPRGCWDTLERLL